MTGNGDSNDRSSDERNRDNRIASRRVDYSEVEHQQRALLGAGFDLTTEEGRTSYRRAASIARRLAEMPYYCDFIEDMLALDRKGVDTGRLIALWRRQLEDKEAKESRQTAWRTPRNTFIITLAGGVTLATLGQLWSGLQWLGHLIFPGLPGGKP